MGIRLIELVQQIMRMELVIELKLQIMGIGLFMKLDLQITGRDCNQIRSKSIVVI